MMKVLCFLSMIVLMSFSKPIPHFIYDGIESFHDCSKETEEISFSIYGTLTEELDSKKMKVENYLIEDMGEFQCSLQNNENSNNKNRKHKIYCLIKGLYERKGYILVEPKVSGFDFNNEEGETSWPKQEEKKTFLIGKCGKKVELDNEPILLGTTGAYSNPLETVRKGIVDQALGSLPKRAGTSEGNMINAMKSAQQTYSLSEPETAYLVYKWICDNIVYDCYGLNHGGIDFTEEGTYAQGKGVCAGYAAIYETMCDSLGLESEYVIGYSKGAGFTPGVIPRQSDHAWNSVKIDGVYYLIDSTWGSGSCDGDNFVKNFREFYFCTNPEAFIRTHLPEEQKWQLISPTITLQNFVNMLLVNEAFYENGFSDISPDAAVISATGGLKVTFSYDPSKNLALINNLYILQGNTYQGLNNACFYTKGNGKVEITCLTNYQGKYMLRIFGGDAGAESYPQLVEYTIESTTTADVPLGFPTIYGSYSNSDTELIEPLYTPLTRGASYNFKIRSTTYKSLYLIIGQNEFKQMNNDGNGLFTLTAKVSGSSVAVCYLEGGYYNYMLTYEVS